MQLDDTKYPEIEVQLTGEDGNIFYIMGRVTRALRRAHVPEAEIKEFTEQVTSSESYDAALQVVMRWVDVS